MPSIKDKYEEVLCTIDKCNIVYSTIKNSHDLHDAHFFLIEAEAKNIPFSNNEVTYKELVFFSYQALIERPQNNLKFIIDINKTLKVAIIPLEFKETICGLRTYHGHFLEKNSKHDEKTIKSCKLWFMEIIHCELPQLSFQYEICAEELIKQLDIFLKGVLKVLDKLAEPDSEELIWVQWNMRQKNFIPQYKMDNVLEVIKDRYSLNIDNRVFFSHFKKKIDDEMAVICDEAKLENCIERLVLLNSFPNGVSGKEVIEKFGLQGETLTNVMKKEKAIERDHPEYTKQKLMEFISDLVEKANQNSNDNA